MTNIPQGPQNSPVANMSNAQHSHGLVGQSQPMEIATNTQAIQVPQQVQQQPTAPMQIPESRPHLRSHRQSSALKIIDPDTGNEVDLTANSISSQTTLPVSY